MSNTANNNNNEKKGKAPWSSVKNSMVSAIAHTKTGSKNTTQTVKIQLTHQKIVDQKHKFGVEYMDLLLQDAPKDALQKCVEGHLQEIMRLRDKLDKYHGIINTNKLKLETKLCKLTGKPLPHTQPSVEVTQASAEEKGPPPPVFPDVDIGGVSANASASASPSASIGASASASPTDSAAVNPFAEDDQDNDDELANQKPSAQPIHAPLTTAVPIAEAVPVSDMNNPFDDDDDDNDNNDKVAPPPAVATATKPAAINPFGDDDDDDDKDEIKTNATSPAVVAAAKPASASINPFGDEDQEDEIVVPASSTAAAKPATPTVNPFEDDDDRTKPSSMNPFDEDDDYNAKKAARSAAKKKTKASKKKTTEC